MAFKPDPACANRFNAGDQVEVVDASSKLFGEMGTVKFFVDDNVYVRFARRRWLPTRMFFADQLRATADPQPSRPIGNFGATTVWEKLRHSLTMALTRKRSSRRLRQR